MFVKCPSMNYEASYINHAPYLPECKARKRRFGDFKLASGLLQIKNPTDEQQAKIDRILALIPPYLIDHISFWHLPGNKHTVFVLTEPYGKHELIHDSGITGIKLPIAISPYCGWWDDRPGAMPKSRSYLFTTRLKAKLLGEIEQRLIEASAQAPAWNYLEPEDHDG